MLYIEHATIYTPDEVIADGAVLVDNDRCHTIDGAQDLTPPADATRIDGTGKLLVPGFIDLQFNGGFGEDFTQDPATIWPVAEKLPRYGVTSFLPTIITSPLSVVRSAQEVLDDEPANFAGAEPLGLHLEGPFLNPGKKGAHNPAYLRQPPLAANGDAIAHWSPENHVRLVTLAPELPDALAMVQTLSERGVIVGAGHSVATLAEATAGFDAGVRYGTHLFNAMPAIHHREPGLPGALLSDERVTIGVVPDGVHVHPALLKVVWAAAAHRLNVVTDAMAAMGNPAGTYILGDYQVTVDATTARLSDGTLAGSIVTMDAALRNLIAYTGCDLQEALSTITRIPADLLGLHTRKGRIAPGFDADLVLLSPELEVAITIAKGKIVYERNAK